MISRIEPHGLSYKLSYFSDINDIKTSSYQHRVSHYTNKTVARPSYLYNGDAVFYIESELKIIQGCQAWPRITVRHVIGGDDWTLWSHPTIAHLYVTWLLTFGEGNQPVRVDTLCKRPKMPSLIFLCKDEQAVKQIIELPVTRDAMMLMWLWRQRNDMTSCKEYTNLYILMIPVASH